MESLNASRRSFKDVAIEGLGMRITLVVVTYGRRWHLLEKVLDACRRQSVANCVIIDNGSAEMIDSLVRDRFGDWAVTISMGRNTGSARAFGEGIARAISAGAEFVLVLDDDNIPTDGCVGVLVDAYKKNFGGKHELPCAVVGYRPDHQANIVQQILSGKARRLKSSFQGFHIFDIPRKIASRLFVVGDKSVSRNIRVVPLPVAPYGGMLFHRSLIEWIGLPNKDFVVYQDDYDFSYRIGLANGKLLLVLDALIEDAEDSWQVAAEGGNSVTVWLNGSNDARIFYTFRNRTYWDRRGRGDAGPIFWINLLVYMTILAGFTVILCRGKRFKVLLSALRAGLSGRLGEDSRFRLV